MDPVDGLVRREFGQTMRRDAWWLQPLVVFLGLFVCRLIPASIAAFVYSASIQVVWSVLALDYTAKATLLAIRFARGSWKSIEV